MSKFCVSLAYLVRIKEYEAEPNVLIIIQIKYQNILNGFDAGNFPKLPKVMGTNKYFLRKVNNYKKYIIVIYCICDSYKYFSKLIVYLNIKMII
jgi:hypothetical protein